MLRLRGLQFLEVPLSHLRRSLNEVEDRSEFIRRKNDLSETIDKVKETLSTIFIGLEQSQFSGILDENLSNLVNEIERRISLLVSEKYYLMKSVRQINDALADSKESFDCRKFFNFFDEMGISVRSDVKADYEKLTLFRRAVDSERNKCLRKELSELNEHLVRIDSKMNELQELRSEYVLRVRAKSFETQIKKAFNEAGQLSQRLSMLEAEKQRFDDKFRLFERYDELVAQLKI